MRRTCGLAHYRLIEKIGAGGMGIVYKAFDTHLKRHVALKILKPELTADSALRQRFLREARSAAAFHHANIVTIYDIGDSDNATFIVMELVEGETLRARMGGRAMPVDQALRIAVDIASGLECAHRERIIHRDLKPENVCIDRDGYAKILDFGLAKLIEVRDRERSEALSQESTRSIELQTNEGAILGTASYMSPEQARGDTVDARSDLFSFGIVLYEMLTGRRPFERGNRLETFAAILREDPKPPSRINHKIPHKLDRIILRCLAKEPGDRYPRTEELLDDLRKALHLPSRVRPRPASAGPLPPSRMWPPAAGVGITVALVATIAIAYFIRQAYLRPDPPMKPVRQVAFMPLEFNGPEEMTHLKDAVPTLLTQAFFGADDVRAVPYEVTRPLPQGQAPSVIGRMVSASWIVYGSLSIEGDRFDLTSRVYELEMDMGGPSVPESVEVAHRLSWSTSLGGEVESLIPRVLALAETIASHLGVKTSAGEVMQPPDPAALALYFEGRAYLRGWDVERSYLKAQELSREALAIEDRFAGAHALLALSLVDQYVELKEPLVIREAEAEAMRAVQLAPSLPEAYEVFGTVLLLRGESVSAAQAFATGLRLAPGNDAFCRRIADAYSDLGRDDEAEPMYLRAVDLRPGLWVNHNAIGVFYLERGRFEEAEVSLRRVVALDPGSEWGYTNLAAVHILKGEHEKAEPLLQASLRLNPDQATHNNLGFVYYAMGRFEDAAEQWTLAIESGSHRPMFYTNLGDAHRQLRQMEAARRAYERAVELGREQLEIKPGNWESRAMISTALAGLGRCDAAREEMERAVIDARKKSTVYYYAAIASMLCNDRMTATRYARLAIEGGIVADVRTNPDLLPLLDDPSIHSLLQ